MPAFRTLQSFACVLNVALFSTVLWSQATPAPVSTPVTSAPSTATSAPVDPNQFMRQAADAMSLTAPDMKPWHLRARFKQSAPDGSALRETLMEEWWAAPDRFKITFTGTDMLRTEYTVGESRSFTGSEKVPDLPAWFILHPLPTRAALDRATYSAKAGSAEEGKLQCFSQAPKQPSKTVLVFSYCFDESAPILRSSETSFGMRTMWNGVVEMNGHYVAKEIQFSNAKTGPSLTIDVEQLDPQLGIDESALVPPADAKPILRKVTIAPGVMAGSKISGDNPDYPGTAKSIRAQGSVVMQVVVDKQGIVQDVEVISGLPILLPAAVKAVKTWRYRPYLLNGEPVQVETTVSVFFDLSR